MHRTKCSGFALIEISIALLILGIMTSISISQFATLKRLNAEQITQRNIDYIVHALGIYYLNKHGSLPDPVQPNQDGFGYVPYKNMGIMEKFTKDGYGNPLLYKFNTDLIEDNKRRLIDIKPVDKIDKSMGISEYASDITHDNVIFSIKTLDGKRTVWYSYKLFTHLFCNCVEYCNISGAAIVYKKPLPQRYVD